VNRNRYYPVEIPCRLLALRSINFVLSALSDLSLQAVFEMHQRKLDTFTIL